MRKESYHFGVHHYLHSFLSMHVKHFRYELCSGATSKICKVWLTILENLNQLTNISIFFKIDVVYKILIVQHNICIVWHKTGQS